MKKKNILNFVYGGILTIVIISIVQIVVSLFKSSDCTYAPTLKNEGRFYYLFKDKASKDFKRIYSVGRINKGWIYSYLYKKELRITIWKLFDYDNLGVNDFVFNNRHKTYFLRSNSYSYSDIGPGPVIRLAKLDCLNLTSKMYINFLGEEKIIDTLKGSNMVKFLGNVKEIDFVNEKNECQLKFYPLKDSILTKLVIVKKKKDILIIFINPVGENSFKINPNNLFDFK